MALRILVAPDSFKGSVSAAEVTAALAAGIRRAHPDAQITAFPMADGGEGTLQALINATQGRQVEVSVEDPLGRKIQGHYGLRGDGSAAVVELAVASGLPLLGEQERDPRRTSTYGTGQLIRHALEHSLPPGGTIIICLGGSATNDGGAGLLSALGFRFLDDEGREIPRGGAALARLARIDDTQVPAHVRQAKYLIACDVTNPLLGPNGATAIFGPQKGATPALVPELEAALSCYADVLERHAGRSVREVPGGGAAGGTAAGMLTLLGATLVPGAELVAEAIGLQDALRPGSWDLVVTGEGRLDEQSAHGKVVSHVTRLAARAGIPTVAIAGGISGGLNDLHALGLSAAFSIVRGPITLDAALRDASRLLEQCAEQVVRLFSVSPLSKP